MPTLWLISVHLQHSAQHVVDIAVEVLQEQVTALDCKSAAKTVATDIYLSRYLPHVYRTSYRQSRIEYRLEI